jgi:hypothetical protein
MGSRQPHVETAASSSVNELRMGSDVGPEVIAGRFCALSPVAPMYFPFLFGLLLEETSGYPWRFRGYTPAFDQFVTEISRDVFAHFVIIDKEAGTPIGYVGGYRLDLRSGHAYLMITMRGRDRMSLAMGDACIEFLKFSFKHWPLRKIFVERPSFIGRRSALSRYCDSEGTLREFIYMDGQYHDLWIESMTRERVEELAARFSLRDGAESEDIYSDDTVKP